MDGEQPASAAGAAPEPWVAGSCGIATQDGVLTVPCVTHPLVPGLAVTMHPFGAFGVTHLQSGRSVFVAAYERAASARLLAAKFAAVLRLAGVTTADAMREPQQIASAIRRVVDQPVPFAGATATDATGERPLTVGEWYQFMRSIVPGFDEFPWESDDDTPEYLTDQVLALLAAQPAPALHEVDAAGPKEPS